MNQIATELITHCIDQFNENTNRIRKCLDELSEDEIWTRPNDTSNSVGNLILHLCGNIGQYVNSSLGKQQDIRDRDIEFSTNDGFTKAQLVNQLNQTVDDAINIMKLLDETELLRMRVVQGFKQTGVKIMVHVTEHYSYHTGQIAFWVKLLRNKDLGFYANINLNAKNEE